MNDAGITRRELLRRGMGAVVAAGAAAVGGYCLYDPKGDAGLRGSSDAAVRLKDYFANVDFPTSNSRISVTTGSGEAIEKMVRAAVGGLDTLLGMKRFVTQGDIVFIKPNVGFDRAPHLGATTHPEVLRAVIRLCREAGADRIIIADNPIEGPEACFARSCIQRVADAEGADVMLPSQAHFKTVVLRDGRPDPRKGEVLACWPIFYRPLADATKVIGVAPIKDHNLCSASMNLKNWYGLLGGRRDQFHQAIHNIVSDLGMMISPTLVIADATRVMLRNGPTGGRLTDVAPGGVLGRPTIVASVDPVACDAWCYQNLLGRDPAKLAYLELAQQKIATQITTGAKRFAERHWQTYQRQGLLATRNV